MANICNVEIKIVGNEENCQELLKMLKWQDEYKNNGISGVGNVYVLASYGLEEEGIAVEASCDVRWSIASSMLTCDPRNLLDETKRLNLAVECFSTEPGCEFAEHYIIRNGKILLEQVVDFYEDEYIEEIYGPYNEIPIEAINMEMSNEDWLCFGGFEDTEFASPEELLNDEYFEGKGTLEESIEYFNSLKEKRNAYYMEQ